MRENGKTIAVIGSGYVGVTTAAIASNVGYKVHLIDIDKKRIDVLKSGKSFFFEKGIDILIKKGIQHGTLIPSTSYSPGIQEASIVFSCVGTPDKPDGSSNIEYVYAASKTASKLLRKGAIYVQKSTVPVGTGEKVKKLLPDFVEYVSNPEFLREGTAIFDTLFFDRIVVGGSDNTAISKVVDVYKSFEKHRNSIAKLSKIKPASNNGLYLKTNLESAELTKVSANAFLALKISFANSIAKLADKTGANIVEVMDAVGADERIGRAFLDAGRGYGGGCFPKDISGLISSASTHGVDMPIMTAVTSVNESMPGYIAEKTQEALGGLKNKNIAVLGLAFKEGTSDARKSPGVKLANILDRAGARVKAYDPQANKEAANELHPNVEIKTSIETTTLDTDAVLITTGWPEFINIDLKYLKNNMKGDLFVDGTNSFDSLKVKECGFRYIAVGKD